MLITFVEVWWGSRGVVGFMKDWICNTTGNQYWLLGDLRTEVVVTLSDLYLEEIFGRV
jgi:hypothetical protein